MAISGLVWDVTIALIVALLLFDYFFHVRAAHFPTLPEAARWSVGYIGIALLFGVAVFIFGGAELGTEYFAGYITEKALSVDNVFVFLVIMSSFKVPRQDQQKALLIGIVFSLVARGGLILLGAALIERFSWVFYVFGLVLLLTAGHLLVPPEKRHDETQRDTLVVRLARRIVPTTGFYDGDKLFTIYKGKRHMTPMVLVILALGATDILFALDSIPAIFGLTQNVFIVFTATAFSLLGLRQLYFLIEGLLERLLYLSYGLAAILAFIGVKLVLHALHQNNLPFINDGEPVGVIEITTGHSLLVIVGILVVTVALSLLSPKGKAKASVTNLRQRVAEYMEAQGPSQAAARDKAYAQLLAAESEVVALAPELKKLIHEPDKLRSQVAQVKATHAGRAAGAPKSATRRTRR